MLVQCNKKTCKTIVNASLDLDLNEAICGECGEVIDGVSDYSKLSMKNSGDVIRSKKRKAFMFYCNTHEKHVETIFKNSVLVGKTCPHDGASCKINITSHMAKAIEETHKKIEKIENME